MGLKMGKFSESYKLLLRMKKARVGDERAVAYWKRWFAERAGFDRQEIEEVLSDKEVNCGGDELSR